jgi:hypothetical protein
LRWSARDGGESKVTAKAKTEAEAREKARARAEAEALAKAKELADFEAKAARRGLAMAGALRLIREGTPQYAELVEGLKGIDDSCDDVKLWVAKIHAVDRKLQEARDTYSKEMPTAPDRSLLERRIQALDDLRDALGSGLQRLGVPRSPSPDKR